MNQKSVLDAVSVAPVYALLLMDDCKLLLPQQDIAILELISDVQLDGEHQRNAVGSILFQGELCPVICLTKHLKLTLEIPQTRQVCVVINNNGSYLGLLCDSVSNCRRRTTHH